jgi:AbrB family looped-hinge helix DNA binding protein
MKSISQIRIATKIGPKHQVTIPREIFSKLDLSVGDYLEFELRDRSAQVTPKKLIPKDNAWFHSPEWQNKEREADRAIRTGDTSGPFTTASALLKHLKKTKRGAA